MCITAPCNCGKKEKHYALKIGDGRYAHFDGTATRNGETMILTGHVYMADSQHSEHPPGEVHVTKSYNTPSESEAIEQMLREFEMRQFVQQCIE